MLRSKPDKSINAQAHGNSNILGLPALSWHPAVHAVWQPSCGVSTKAKSFERLMAGERAKIIFSDFPYDILNKKITIVEKDRSRKVNILEAQIHRFAATIASEAGRRTTRKSAITPALRKPDFPCKGRFHGVAHALRSSLIFRCLKKRSVAMSLTETNRPDNSADETGRRRRSAELVGKSRFCQPPGYGRREYTAQTRRNWDVCAARGHGLRSSGKRVVEPRGIEPRTFALRTRRSPI